MGIAPEVIDLSIPCLADYVSVVRLSVSGVAARLNFTINDIEDIKIAVSEACTNAVQHAYPDRDDGRIEISYLMHKDKLEIIVKDHGKGFDPKNASSFKTNEGHVNKFGLGLGITFIKTLMDEATVDSSAGKGTTVTMIKLITPA
jgi:serine/threonine-protein kinase RsbW